MVILFQNGTTTLTNGGLQPNGNSHVQNGHLPPLKNGLGNLADDLYLNRLHTKIGPEMDMDVPNKFHDDYMVSNGNGYYDDKVSSNLTKASSPAGCRKTRIWFE